MVLVPAHDAGRGLRLQGVRFGKRRPRALDRAYGVRGSDDTAARATARKHRDTNAGIFLGRSPGSRLSARPGTTDHLALRELEASARFGLAVLFAFDHARVTGEKAAALEHGAQIGFVPHQRLGDTVAHR